VGIGKACLITFEEIEREGDPAFDGECEQLQLLHRSPDKKYRYSHREDNDIPYER
jgi:hypothetical protein